MISMPPKDRTADAAGSPQVELNWIEFIVLARLPARFRDPYLVWKFQRNVDRAHRSLEAKCPACGNFSKCEMRWTDQFKWADGMAGALIRLCPICKASWGEKPVIAYQDWKINLRPQEVAPMFEMPSTERKSA